MSPRAILQLLQVPVLGKFLRRGNQKLISNFGVGPKNSLRRQFQNTGAAPPQRGDPERGEVLDHANHTKACIQINNVDREAQTYGVDALAGHNPEPMAAPQSRAAQQPQQPGDVRIRDAHAKAQERLPGLIIDAQFLFHRSTPFEPLKPYSSPNMPLVCVAGNAR